MRIVELEDAIDAFNRVSAALTGAMKHPTLTEESKRVLAEVFEESHALREKVQAIRSSIGTGKVRISRIPPEPEKTMARTISDRGLKLIGKFEGCVLKVYNDVAGHATIGYGHLLHHGRFTPSDPQSITQTQADELLRKDAAIHAEAVNRAVTVQLTQNQFDALVSLSFNIGAGGMTSSSLVRAINAGKSSDAAEIRRLFCLWCKAGGKTNQGLLGRRNSEATVFLTPDTPDTLTTGAKS